MNKYFIIIGILVLVIIYLMASKCTINLDGNNYENSDNYENYESGSSENSLLSSDINGNIKLLSYPSFPKGMIMLWSGSVSSIPKGWSLCDGTKGTPDLRGRFVVGASTSAGSGVSLRNVNDKGGKEVHTLTIDEMPSHNHNQHGGPCSGTNCARNSSFGWNGGGYGNNYSNDLTGGGKPHENMPPFYALCYICYTG